MHILRTDWKYKEIINWTKYASACRHWKYLYYAVLIHTYMNECVENSIHEYLEPQLLNEETYYYWINKVFSLVVHAAMRVMSIAEK